MLYVRQPTEEERAELTRMRRQEIGRVSRRAQMVLLSAQRRTVPEIAALFEVSRATVRFWVRQFDAAGPAGLRDEPRSGRPRKVTPQVEGELATWLARDPQQADPTYLATFWTVAMLLLTASSRLQLALAPTTLRTALHRLGLRWRRPRLAMPRKTDPEKAAKQWRIAEAVLGAGPEAAILYADESRVQTLPLVRAMWWWVGQQWRIPTPGSNAARAIFGALEIRTGRWTYLVRERMRKEDFIAFLEQLLAAYPARPLIPCTPRKTRSRCSLRRLCTATGPTNASDGVRTPPVSTTLRSGWAASRSTSATRIELVTTVRPAMAPSARASVHVVVPAEIPIAVPGRTSAAASLAIASFCARCRLDFASNPGSSVLSPRIAVAPP